jgi:predicted O-methyltransferase YrrM
MRHLKMGLNTLFGYQKQGFFIPYRYADTLPTATERSTYKAVEAFMASHEAIFQTVLDHLDKYASEFAEFGKMPPPDPRWEQDWFPRLDAAIAYDFVRTRKPKHIVEVGSGHSTRFMARAIRDGNLDTQLTTIDPAPRAAIDALPIEIIRTTLHDAPDHPFQTLEAGDILFIDSSHIAMPGSDVDKLFLDILPTLPPGVIVHIHDIFLPDDYPESWDWRGYNEQLVAAPLVLSNGYEILFSSAYVSTRMQDALKESVIGSIHIPEGAFETSLWIQKQNITDI